MGTYSDVVSITTAAADTEVTGTINIVSGSKLIEIEVCGLDTADAPSLVTLSFVGITAPQRYSTGLCVIGAVAAGLSMVRVIIPIDVDVPGTVAQVTVGLSSLGAGTWRVGLKWVK